MGSGTTIFVAERLERNTVGIEILPEYFKVVEKSFKPVPEKRTSQLALLDKKGKYATDKSK